MTPYNYWRRAHAMHHATSGNLDRRGVGDITTLTVDEYQALGPWGRLAYRLYRHPLVLFGIGPLYLFVLKHRLPWDLPLAQRDLWFSVLWTNAAIVGLTVVMVLLVGPLDLLLVQLPVTLLASSMGVWLFFVQHQFPDPYWRHQDGWDFHRAALEGSSYYRLPKPLQWFTASLGLHHVHHLCSRVPNYRLQECLDRIPELRLAKRLTLWQSLGCARLTLVDEASGRMIGFRDLRRSSREPARDAAVGTGG
jgi:omega-6 fatty acid desaturase (delta-12 desaturase)